MGKRAELEMEAIRLYADGNEIPAIAEAIAVSENSLRTWKRRAGTEWDDARKATRQVRLESMETVAARFARSKLISDQLTGDAKSQSGLGLALNQGLQTMLYDLMEQMQTTGLIDPEQLTAAIDQFTALTLALGRLEQSASRNQKTAQEIRKQTLEEAAKTIEKTATAAGVTPEAIQMIRRDVLMMAA